MDRDLVESKIKELTRRGILPQDVITRDNDNILLSKTTYRLVANILSAQFHRKLTTNEVNFIRNMMDRMSTSQFYNMHYSQALNHIAQMIHHRIKNPDTSVSSVRQYQKKALGQLTADEHPYKFSAFNKEDGEIEFNDTVKRNLGDHRIANDDPVQQAMFELTKSIGDMNNIWRSFVNPSHLRHILKDAHAIRIGSNDIALRDQYIPFDSRHRKLEFNTPRANAPIVSGNNTIIPMEFQWEINISSNFGQNGQLLVTNELQEVIQMEIGEILIPTINLGVDIDIYYDRITLLIKEFQEQSARTADGHRYHFIFKVEKITNNACPAESRLRLTPIFSKYIFFYPIKRVENITVVFRNLYRKVNLLSDVVYLNISGVTFTVAVSGGVHGMLSGEVVYFDKVSSGAPAEDNLLSRPEGHIITVTGANTFQINTAGGNDVNIIFTSTVSNVRAYIGCRRVHIPIHFKSLQ